MELGILVEHVSVLDEICGKVVVGTDHMTKLD
jgi:hypothetical protein